MHKAVFFAVLWLAVSAHADSLPPASAAQRHRPEQASIGNDSAISEYFIPSSDLIGQWSVLLEPPDPIDPELRDQGLREAAVRHYTRTRGPKSEACTVELWGFSRAETAQRAADSIDMPNWKILRSNEILVLVHGVLLERGVGSRSDLVADCESLGEQTYERISRMR